MKLNQNQFDIKVKNINELRNFNVRGEEVFIFVEENSTLYHLVNENSDNYLPLPESENVVIKTNNGMAYAIAGPDARIKQKYRIFISANGDDSNDGSNMLNTKKSFSFLEHPLFPRTIDGGLELYIDNTYIYTHGDFIQQGLVLYKFHSSDGNGQIVIKPFQENTPQNLNFSDFHDNPNAADYRAGFSLGFGGGGVNVNKHLVGQRPQFPFDPVNWGAFVRLYNFPVVQASITPVIDNHFNPSEDQLQTLELHTLAFTQDGSTATSLGSNFIRIENCYNIFISIEGFTIQNNDYIGVYNTNNLTLVIHKTILYDNLRFNGNKKLSIQFKSARWFMRTQTELDDIYIDFFNSTLVLDKRLELLNSTVKFYNSYIYQNSSAALMRLVNSKLYTNNTYIGYSSNLYMLFLVNSDWIIDKTNRALRNRIEVDKKGSGLFFEKTTPFNFKGVKTSIHEDFWSSGTVFSPSGYITIYDDSTDPRIIDYLKANTLEYPDIIFGNQRNFFADFPNEVPKAEKINYFDDITFDYYRNPSFFIMNEKTLLNRKVYVNHSYYMRYINDWQSFALSFFGRFFDGNLPHDEHIWERKYSAYRWDLLLYDVDDSENKLTLKNKLSNVRIATTEDLENIVNSFLTTAYQNDVVFQMIGYLEFSDRRLDTKDIKPINLLYHFMGGRIATNKYTQMYDAIFDEGKYNSTVDNLYTEMWRYMFGITPTFEQAARTTHISRNKRGRSILPPRICSDYLYSYYVESPIGRYVFNTDTHNFSTMPTGEPFKLAPFLGSGDEDSPAPDGANSSYCKAAMFVLLHYDFNSYGAVHNMQFKFLTTPPDYPEMFMGDWDSIVYVRQFRYNNNATIKLYPYGIDTLIIPPLPEIYKDVEKITIALEWLDPFRSRQVVELSNGKDYFLPEFDNYNPRDAFGNQTIGRIKILPSVGKALTAPILITRSPKETLKNSKFRFIILNNDTGTVLLSTQWFGFAVRKVVGPIWIKTLPEY